ncbi:MAG: SMP-30/gluconolactonase/LRE family protein, partial [Alkalispirochaeta sp.]
MTQHPDYHVVSSTPNILGEGPIWDPRSEAFLWVDAYRRGFFSVPVGDGGIGTPQFHPTGLFTIGITALGREAGRYLLAGADGLYEYTTRDASPDGAKRVADAPFARISQEYGTPRRSVPSRGTAPVPNALPPATAGTHRFNDVIAAPDGSYLAGMMPWNPGAGAYNDGGGALVRYTRRDRVALVLPNPATPDLPKPRLPNGMGFSPDGRWFYWTDTLRKT